MSYNITFKRKAIKALVKINEPHYSAIKSAIYDLANNPRPNGYIKLKGVMANILVWVLTELFTIFLMKNW